MGSTFATAFITAAITTLASIIVTFIFNAIVNHPKKKREEEEKKEAQRKQELEDMEKRLQVSIEQVKQERIAEREACGKDHQGLVAIVMDIKKSNESQNVGLQAVLKDLLKIRYLEWINKGYAPMDARDDLERMYNAYHRLGANGIMDSLRNKFLNLPVCKEEDCNDYRKEEN